jgi:hypothetical protein
MGSSLTVPSVASAMHILLVDLSSVYMYVQRKMRGERLGNRKHHPSCDAKR